MIIRHFLNNFLTSKIKARSWYRSKLLSNPIFYKVIDCAKKILTSIYNILYILSVSDIKVDINTLEINNILKKLIAFLSGKDIENIKLEREEEDIYTNYKKFLKRIMEIEQGFFPRLRGNNGTSLEQLDKEFWNNFNIKCDTNDPIIKKMCNN